MNKAGHSTTPVITRDLNSHVGLYQAPDGEWEVVSDAVIDVGRVREV